MGIGLIEGYFQYQRNDGYQKLSISVTSLMKTITLVMKVSTNIITAHPGARVAQ